MNGYISTHPGKVLKMELMARNIQQKRFAELINVSYTMLNEILNGKRSVTSDFALLIEASIGINAELLINLQSKYDLAESRKNSKNISRLEFIRKACAIL